MSNKYRKVLAAVLAAAMVLGGFVADAASGSGQGGGSLDIVKYPDVFQVVLPTNAGRQFNYILDPTGILVNVGADKYGGATFEPGKTMYFHHKPASGSNTPHYTDVSEPITAYNKSNIDVEIKIKAKLSAPSGITVSATRTAGDTSTDPKMYLALTEGPVSTEKAVTEQGIVATASIASAAIHYKTIYDGHSDMYKNVLKDPAASADEEDYGTFFKSYSFMLTGDCNPGGKWEDLKSTPPSISVVWSIEKMEGAALGESGMPELPDNPNNPATPSVPGGPSMTISKTGLITITGLTADINYRNRLTLTYGGQTTNNLDDDLDLTWYGVGNEWTSAKGGTLKIQLGPSWMNAVKGKSVTATVKLTNGQMISATEQF